MRFEIEAEIPEGYEPTGEYRLGMQGDSWLSVDGSVGRGCAETLRVILREKWQWPAWLKVSHITFDSEYWYSCSGSYVIWLIPGLLDFTPPPGDHKAGDRVFNPNRREP